MPPRPSNLKGYIPVDELKEIDVTKKHRTIMVIGATGTGKTTLLNSMMNYLWGVKHDDKHRYKLVYEIEKKDGYQAVSQTDNVTAYNLDSPVLGFQLTVIDTPGYGDTRGIGQDKKITKNIKDFFENKIQEIDAICFVIRAPQARLTPTQKYIFDQVLGIFGHDIAENILILMTFADGEDPPALAAIKAGKVPFKESFKLNNSGFKLPNNGKGDIFGEMLWNLGMDSFRTLFESIDNLKTKSLTLTKQVLTRREQLENYIVAVKPQINAGMNVLDSIRQKIVIIEKFADLINANKDFMITHTVNKARETPNNGGNTTTCLTCNFTCHRSCGYSDDADKKDCCAMGGDGYCCNCPGKCHWSIHKNRPYTIEWYTEEVKRPVKDLKDKYTDATSKLSITDQLVCGLINDLTKVEQDLNGLISGVRDCLNELSTIALRPNVLSQDDYMDKLIQSEEVEKKKGWQTRIKALRQLKEKQETLSRINSNDYNPWKQYDDVENFLEKNKNKNNKRGKKKKSNKRGWFGFF
jgi:GTP-binding protein EngB required for normal cell division